MALPRFVELVRVSGGAQAAKDTPEDQRRALDHLRVTRPGILVERIEEGAAGLSGALPYDQRPDLQRLVKLAKARAFDEVRVRHIDRLTRHEDPRERWAIYGWVADASAVIVDGAGHVTDPTSEMGEIDYFLQGVMASKERKRILERTVTARKRLAAEGKLQGRPPYARTWDKATGTWGVNEEQVKVYRSLFAKVLRGESLHDIADELNDQGVPPPGAKLRGKGKGHGKWRAEAVGHLLKHRSAIGEIRSAGYDLRCPPIVDADTFKKTAKAYQWSRAGMKPLDASVAILRKVAVCSVCGSRLWVVTGGRKESPGRYYVCGSFRTARNVECRKFHNVTKTDEAAKDAIIAWVEEGIAGGSSSADPAGAARRVQDAEARLKELGKQEAHLVKVARMASAEAVEAELAELTREREEVRRALEAARTEAAPVIAPIDARRSAAILARMRKASLAELRSLVAELLRPGSVRVHPDRRVEIRPTG